MAPSLQLFLFPMLLSMTAGQLIFPILDLNLHRHGNEHVFVLPGSEACMSEAAQHCSSIIKKCGAGQSEECEVQCLAPQPPPLSGSFGHE